MIHDLLEDLALLAQYGYLLLAVLEALPCNLKDKALVDLVLLFDEPLHVKVCFLHLQVAIRVAEINKVLT